MRPLRAGKKTGKLCGVNQNAPVAASEQQAAPDTTITAGEQPAVIDQQAPAEYSESEIYQILEAAERGETYEPTSEVKPPDATATPATTPASEQPAEETPEVQEAAKGKQRISVRGMNDRARQQFAEAADLVRSGAAADLTSAIEILKEAQAAPETIQQAAPAVPDEVSAIATQIADLREQRRQAKADYDTEKEDALTIQIEDLQIERLRVEQSTAARTAQAMTYQQEYDLAIDQLEAEYPEAADETSAFYQDLSDKVDAAKFRKDPILADPKFVLRLAADLKAKSNGHAPAQVQARPAPALPPARVSRPVGSALAAAQNQPARMSDDDLMKAVREMPMEDVARLIYDH
ncbi:MAG: hypothetical protein WCO57_04660 [Verrucomicrobiota bacterium]